MHSLQRRSIICAIMKNIPSPRKIEDVRTEQGGVTFIHTEGVYFVTGTYPNLNVWCNNMPAPDMQRILNKRPGRKKKPAIKNSPLNLLRRKRGLTILEVARAVGVHPSNIGRIERGQQMPTTELIDRIIRYFDNEITVLQICQPGKTHV